MDSLVQLAESWWPLYAVHMLELSIFILLVWAVDRWVNLDTRLRYSLWLLALAKAFVPPFYAVPIPEFLIAAPESVAAVAVGKSLYLSANLETDFVASVPVSTPIPMAFYLFCLWAVSALVLAGATLWKNATFQSALGVALPVNLTGKIENLAGAEGLEVFAKANLNSPLLVGLVKPRLYLPSQWSSWSPEQLRGVVAHELAHHRNRDIWALIFQALAIALFGVNPLIWLANKNLTHLRELRCDEAVLRETDLTPAEYGRLLFGFVDATGRPVLNALYFNERGTSLKERFEHVLNFKRGTMKRSKWQLAIPILVGLAIVPLSIREAYTQAPESVQPIVSIRDTEVRPKLESAVGPLYPSELRNAGVEGDVLMGFVVDPGGQVRDIRLLEGRAQFEQAATDALKQFKFEPLLNGQPIQMTQAIRFSLPKENSEDYAMPETLRSKSYLGPIVVIGHVGDKLSYRMSIPEHAQSDPQGTPVKINASNVLKFRIGKPEQDGQRRAQREEPKFQVAHGSPEVEKVAHIWINNLGELLVNKEKQIKATDLARELQRLKAVQGIEEVQIKLDQLVPDKIQQQVIQIARRRGLKVGMDVSTGTFNLKHVSEYPDPSQASGWTEGKIYDFYVAQEKPVLLHSVPPVYPNKARKAGMAGKVFLELLIHKDGSVSNVIVLRGQEIFRQAAIDAIQKFRFQPAKHNGQIVPVWMTVPVTFRLGQKKNGDATGNLNSPPDLGTTDNSDVIEFFKVEVKPELLSSVKPVYPEAAMTEKAEGRVFLKFKVNVNGTVSDVSVLKGTDVFEQAAIDAMLQFKFKPAEQDGKPVAVWMTQPINFKLGPKWAPFDLGRFVINPPNIEGKEYVQVRVLLTPQNSKAKGAFETHTTKINNQALGYMTGVSLQQWKTPVGRQVIANGIKARINSLFEDAVVRVLFTDVLISGEPAEGHLAAKDTDSEILDFKLHANFPNPFNPETSIKYDLAEATFVTLDIRSVTGQVIRTLVSDTQSAGRYTVRWDGKDGKGRPVASGTYYYNLKTDHFSDVKKMQLLK